MSIISVIGILILIFLGIIMICLASIWWEKNFPNEKFDERQAAAQGRAWRLSGIVSMIYYTVAMVPMIRQVTEEKTVEPYLIVFAGILLQAVVYNVYTLLTYSFTDPARKAYKYPILTLVGAVLASSGIWICLQQYPLSLVGEGSVGWFYIISVVGAVLIAVLHLLHLLRREKE